MLQTREMTKRYGALVVTDNVSLDIRRGELHAVIGPNGAGKTSLINQLSGELALDSGTIRFDGRDVTGMPIDERARLGLVRSYQVTSVFAEFTVLENATLAAFAARKPAVNAWKSLLRDDESVRCAEDALEAAGLGSHTQLTAGKLGYGERRQLELAMALAARPKLLLLDEPMAGMSVKESAAVVALLQKLKRKYTILLVEHDMDAVFTLADRISVVVYGKIIITGTPQDIRENPEVRATYLGDEEAAA
jgi:branched-chain amino acid transport system ATP-binding protein